MKGNAVYAVLLFLLLPVSVLSNDFSHRLKCDVLAFPDTIIIDGETIFIEKEYVKTNVDSLVDDKRKDVRLKPIPLHLFSAALHVGMNATTATFGTSTSDFVPLNNFVENKVSVQSNFTSSIDFAIRVWKFPALNGMCNLEIHSGIGYNNVKFQTASIDEDSLVRDSLILLRFTDNELYLDYFDIFAPGPIGELDTAIIPIHRNLINYSILDVPLKLHGAWTPQKSLWTFYAEAGIIKRYVLKSSTPAFDNYLVNSSGEFLKQRANDFVPRNMLRPAFGFGAERVIEKRTESSGSYFSVGLALNAVLPSTSFNQSSLFYVDIKSFSISAFVKLHL